MKTNLMNTLKQIKTLKKEIQKNLEQFLLYEAVAIHKDFPEIIQISWVQYTPSFNDGDPCVFSLGGIGFFTEESFKEAEKDGEEVDYDLEEYSVLYNDNIPGKLKSKLEEFTRLLNDLEDELGDSFGTEGVQVDIDLIKGTLTLSEYDCGY